MTLGRRLPSAVATGPRSSKPCPRTWKEIERLTR